MPVPRIAEGALGCGRTQGSADLVEWFGQFARRWTQEAWQGKAHAAHFSGEVMKAPRRPARSPLTASLFEQLEARQLLAAVDLTGGVLTVQGTAKADNIRVNIAGNQVVVHLNRSTKTFSTTGLDQLRVNAGSGNDKVDVTGKLGSILIDGGPGNDNIRGSGAVDLITGVTGNDFV